MILEGGSYSRNSALCRSLLGQRGSEADGFRPVSPGAFRVAELFVSGGPVEVSPCKLGVEPDRLGEVGDGAVVVALLVVSEAAVAERHGRTGFEAKRLGV